MTALEDFVVALRPCTPWCEAGDMHPNEHPEDRSCWSTYEHVTTSRHEPSKYDDGRWLMAWLNVYLRRKVGEDEPLVYIHSEETDKELILTVGEANQLVAKLLGLIETAT